MKHLTEEQISRMTAGLDVFDAEHVHECTQCAAEVDQSTEVFFQFGAAMRDWTLCQQPRELKWHPSRVSHRAPVAWALAGAVLAMLIAFPVYRDVRDRQIKEQAEQDSRLIDAVNAQLSRQTPAALQTLMQLMNESSPAEDKTDSRGGLQ